MDMSDFSSLRSPRRELQGPRPAPLKVRKDSHKIKKPPMAPQQAGHQSQHHPAPPPPPPVIIYTVSPKIIHANPNEFMSLVQRLTGPSSTYTSSTTSMNPASSSSSGFVSQERCGAVSPAARFASIENAKSPTGRKTLVLDHAMDMEQGVQFGTEQIQRTGQFPGILSPNPNALPPIHPNYFSPQSDSNALSFFFDLSPVLHSNRNYGSVNNFTMPSPSLISPQINMPSPNTLNLLNSLYEF